jgi:hypothetical protein
MENADDRQGPPSRPPPCPRCAARTWWNGRRCIHAVLCDEDGKPARVERILRRAKCSACLVSFTCPSEDLYPRRQYQLDVVADVVAAMALGAASAASAASKAGASATSARRWTTWVAELAEPRELLAVAAQIGAAPHVGAGVSLRSGFGVRGRAALVLDALEHLGAALVRCGVALVARSGLGRVLVWQRASQREVLGVASAPKNLSPRRVIG